jgi:hypothetical protein
VPLKEGNIFLNIYIKFMLQMVRTLQISERQRGGGEFFCVDVDVL